MVEKRICWMLFNSSDIYWKNMNVELFKKTVKTQTRIFKTETFCRDA